MDNPQGVKLTDFAKNIKISMQIDNKYIRKNREYKMMRNHNGKVAFLDGTYNANTKTITFESNKFSTYALAYKDVKNKTIVVSSKTNSSNKTISTATNPKTTKQINTNDSKSVTVYVCIIMIATIGIIVFRRKVKN